MNHMHRKFYLLLMQSRFPPFCICTHDWLLCMRFGSGRSPFGYCACVLGLGGPLLVTVHVFWVWEVPFWLLCMCLGLGGPLLVTVHVFWVWEVPFWLLCMCFGSGRSPTHVLSGLCTKYETYAFDMKVLLLILSTSSFFIPLSTVGPCTFFVFGLST